MPEQQIALTIQERAQNQLSAGSPTDRKERLHYFDWLKMIAVLGVFFSHMAWLFDILYSWKVENTKAYALVMFGTQWGMSIFFLIAGANGWFSLRSRTSRQFLRERFIRLVLPFIAAVILIAPLQAYFVDLSRSAFHGSYSEYFMDLVSRIQLSWNPQSLTAYSFHLWFLAFLFLFSLLALPLFVFLRRKPGQHFVSRLATACERRGGIFALMLPLVLIQAALRASFPGYQGWTDFLIWFVYFVYGYIFLSDQRFDQAIQKQGVPSLIVGVTSFLIIVATMYGPPFMNFWQSTPSYSVTYVLYQLLFSITAWSLMIFVLYFARRFLNFDNRVIGYASKAILPFYILHYLIITMITYFFVGWNMNIVMRFSLVSILALAATLAVYDLLIKRIGVIRWLFGMKPK